MPKPLSVTKSIGPTAARELLFFFIRNAENGHDFLRNMTDGDVEAWAKLNGYPWQETIDELANDFFRIVPEFENIASSASSIIETTGGASAEVTFSVDGVPVQTHKAELGSTTVLRLSYLANWVAACKARDAAIESGDVDEVLTMITKAFASIEAFLAMRAHVFNAKNAESEKLLDPDSRGRFVSTEAKLKKWMPILAPHFSIDLGKSKGWTTTLRLKKLRDDVAIHPKVGKKLAARLKSRAR